MPISPYRPHDKGHDYHGIGTYLITLVVRNRARLLSHFAYPPATTAAAATTTAATAAAATTATAAASTANSLADFGQGKSPGSDLGQGKSPSSDLGQGKRPGLTQEQAREALVLSPLGQAIQQAWLETPAKQAAHGNHVAVLASVCMPDHFHGVIEVRAAMQWSLGDIIQAFKATCTRQWQQMQGLPSSTDRPIPAKCLDPSAPAWLREKAAEHRSEGALVRSLSKKQRLEYYALVGSQLQQPLFDDDYDDTICLDSRHQEAMVAYVNDNPRRAILRQLLPNSLQRCLHLQFGNRSYGAFGNIFLLRWPRKIQVMCHRRHPLSLLPYESTEDFERQRQACEAAILEGCTVAVTPGISRGELLIKNECLAKGYPLIHLQKEPIGRYWKPERQRFEACANGSLLILAPWGLDDMSGVRGVASDTDYSRFHNLNALAAEICTFYGPANIVKT